MSMSTEVIGFRAPDAKWRKMKGVWDACKAAGVNAPDEVADFFGYEDPDERGVEVEVPAYEWSDDNRAGYEVELSRLPDGLTHIRFYNSW